MKTLTQIEVEKAAMLKAARAAIRLKYALKADAEIAEVLPKLEEMMNTAIVSGEPFELTVGKLFDEA
jgi:hypothetical protein